MNLKRWKASSTEGPGNSPNKNKTTRVIVAGMTFLHPLTLITISKHKSMLESQMQNLVRFLRTLQVSVASD